MKIKNKDRLPTEWNEREKLRNKGQFWTPDWVAEAMVAYVSQDSELVFDPGVGKGAFYSALKKVSQGKKFYGIDNDISIINEARQENIFGADAELEFRDFILDPPKSLFKAIVSNPPYIRHHRLSIEIKTIFREISKRTMNETLDGRAGLHIYFLIQALNLLDKGGRLAFIMPADTCEGIFSNKLWNWISKKFCIDGVITFDHKATPFPGVDTNSLIFLIRNCSPKKTVMWVKCLVPKSTELLSFVKGNLNYNKIFKEIEVHESDLSDVLKTGLSRRPQKNNHFEFTLSDFAHVMRGIATGANEFFLLTKERVKEIGISCKYFSPAIGRTRDVDGSYITKETLYNLEKKGRPTLLLIANNIKSYEMPESVKNYLLKGEKDGLPNRALISMRKPWYKMEEREIPPFLFAYLGRRNARFIKNEAGILPLTGFLCVYPHSNDSEYVDKLWSILQDPGTINNLQLVGKSYGSGAIKVEPRSLERLPINSDLVKKIGIEPLKSELPLF